MMDNDYIETLAQAKSEKLDTLIQALDTTPALNDSVEDDWWSSSY